MNESSPQRPCTWPDGGCGEPVTFIPTGKIKPDGSDVLQVVDAKPEKRTVRVWREGRGGPWALAPDNADPAFVRGRVIDTWRDHHASCAKWLARVARERAATQATKADR